MIKLTAKIFIVLIVITCFTNNADARKKKKNNLSNLSKEAIEEMKLEQNLVNLSGNEYNYFESAVYNFEKMGEDAVNPLLEHLKKNQDDKKIVNAVLYTLGRLKGNGARAVPTIMMYLKNPDYDTKVTAVSALGRIGEASEKAIPVLKTLLYDEEDWLTAVTKRTLRDMDTPMSRAALEEFNKYNLLKKRRKEMSANN